MKVKVLHFKFAKLVSLSLLTAAFAAVKQIIFCHVVDTLNIIFFILNTQKSRLEARLL